MKHSATDLRAVEPDVAESAIVEFGELLEGGPVTPPSGESPDQLSEVHFRFLS